MTYGVRNQIAVSPGEQRTIARQVCTAKEYEAWEMVELRGYTRMLAADDLGISIGSLQERIKNARAKILHYVRSEFNSSRVIADSTPDQKATESNMAIALLLQRDGPRCYLCRVIPPSYTVDHIIPTVRGGTNEAHNLALACITCNASKGGRIVSLRVSSGRPVYHAGGRRSSM